MFNKVRKKFDWICEKCDEIFFKINCKVGHFIDPRDEFTSTVISIFVYFIIIALILAAPK